MRKILMLGMTLGYGGIESFIMNVFRNLPKDQYEFYFVKSDDQIAYEEELLAAKATIFKITPRSVDMKLHYREMEAIFKTHTFDIVWSNRCMLNSIVEMKYAKKYGCPIRIMHAHSSKNTGSNITQLMHEYNKRNLDRYCTLKLSCSSEASAYFFKSTQHVTIVKNGLDVKQYLYDETRNRNMRASFGFHDELIIGHVGRFTFEKNQKFVLDVHKEVLENIPNAQLLLCGKGPLFEECKAYANTLGIEHNVHFLGEVKNIPDIFQCMDIFVFPSLFEGLPYAALEAQFSGLKCFISKHVSKEVKICEDTELLEITDVTLWAKRIIAHQHFKKQRDEELLQSPFNIQETCKQIETLLG